MKTEEKQKGKKQKSQSQGWPFAGDAINEWKRILEMFPMGISLRWGNQEVGSLELIPTGVTDKIYIFTCITFD